MCDYNQPFWYFDGFGIKPSLLLFYLFAAALTVWICHSRKLAVRDGKRFKPEINKRRAKALSILYIANLLLLCALLRNSGEAPLPSGLISTFLSYENALAWGLFLVFAVGLATIRDNALPFLRVVARAASVLLGLCVFCTLATAQIRPEKCQNTPLLLVLGVAFVALASCDLKLEAAVKKETGSFEPVERYSALLPERKAEADQIITLLSDGPGKPISICVNGGWGSGKTSVVNGALEKLKEDSTHRHEVIHVNALAMDTQESLISYVFEQIKRCLKARGAYVGLGSEYRGAVTSLLKTATNASIATLVESELFPAAGDYRAQKKQLEELVSGVMGKDRIIIVVDDIERCPAEKAKQFVYFAKEIAAMDCCAIIFVADYLQLRSAPGGAAGTDGDAAAEYSFYEKFFHYRIDLKAIDVPNAIRVKDRGRTYLDAHNYAEFRRAPEVFQTLSARIPGAENEAYLLNSALFAALNNPRKLEKLFHAMEVNCGKIETAFREKALSETSPFFRLVRLDEVLFLLSFIEACFPDEAKSLRMQGRQYFEAMREAQLQGDRALIRILADTLFFTANKPGTLFHISYAQGKALRLIDAFFKHPEILSEIIDPFTRLEEEWFDALDKGDSKQLNENWADTFYAVIHVPFSQPNVEQAALDQAYARLRVLFAFIRNKVAAGTLAGDEAFSIFDRSARIEYILNRELFIMEIADEYLGSPDVVNRTTAQAAETLLDFSQRFAYVRMGCVSNLLCFFLQPEHETVDQQRLEGARQGMQQGIPIEMRLKSYLAQLGKLALLPTTYPDEPNVFRRLEKISDDVEAYLEQKGLLAFDDVRQELVLMRGSIADLKHLASLQVKLKKRTGIDREITTDAVRERSVDENIEYFNLTLNDANIVNKSEYRHSFEAFFQMLRDGRSLPLSDEQLDALHTLAAKYCDVTGQKPFYYRKILMDCRDRRTADPRG